MYALMKWKLEGRVEEGICDVMSCKWMNWYIANNCSDDQFVKDVRGLKYALQQLVKKKENFPIFN